jgi:hypothetical protein
VLGRLADSYGTGEDKARGEREHCKGSRAHDRGKAPSGSQARCDSSWQSQIGGEERSGRLLSTNQLTWAATLLPVGWRCGVSSRLSTAHRPRSFRPLRQSWEPKSKNRTARATPAQQMSGEGDTSASTRAGWKCEQRTKHEYRERTKSEGSGAKTPPAA